LKCCIAFEIRKKLYFFIDTASSHLRQFSQSILNPHQPSFLTDRLRIKPFCSILLLSSIKKLFFDKLQFVAYADLFEALHGEKTKKKVKGREMGTSEERL